MKHISFSMIKQFAKNEYIFSISSRIITILVAFFQSILVARYLGSTLQGDMASVTSISSIGAIFITFGLHQAYPYLWKTYGKDSIYNQYLSIIVLYFTVWMILGLILAVRFFNSLNYSGAIILIPIQGYANVVGYICLVENPNKRNKLWTITAFAEVFLVILLYLLTESNWFYAFFIYSFVEVVRGIVFTIMLKPYIEFNMKLILLFKKLLLMGFFPMLALLMTTLNYKIDILMLQIFDNITSSDIGVYSVGISIVDKIAIVPDTLMGVLVSKLAKGKDEYEVAKVCRISLWFNIIIGLALVILGPNIITFLYGDAYREAYSIIIICAAGTIFIGYFKLIAQYNIVNKKQARNVILLSVSNITNIILNILLIPHYSLQGAALASGCGYFISGMIFVLWFSRNNKISLGVMFIPQKSDFNFIKDKLNMI